MSTRRVEWLDFAKGLGIILVVMGHTLFPVHAAIDVFHMPLFFILAGIVFKPLCTETFLLKKIDSIFIPYIFFKIISYPISFFVPHDGGFNGPLWFLLTLFEALLLLIFSFSIGMKKNLSKSTMGGDFDYINDCHKIYFAT